MDDLWELFQVYDGSSFTVNLAVTNIFETCSRAFETCSRAAIYFFQNDIPDLLGKTANAMHKADFSSLLSFSRLLDLAPIVGGIALVSTAPFLLLCCNDQKPRSHDITRMLLIKMQALLYAMGFAVSALQHRALWGSTGLSPHTPPFNRPSPLFQLFGFGDLQLETVSWIGLCVACCILRNINAACSCTMFVLWICYLSIVNCEAPFTYHYGWEWGTLELGFLAIFLVPLVPNIQMFADFAIGFGVYKKLANR